MGFLVPLGACGRAVCEGTGRARQRVVCSGLLPESVAKVSTCASPCVVFVFTYPSAAVLFPFISLQRLHRLSLCLTSSKDLSPASGGGLAAINIQL